MNNKKLTAAHVEVMVRLAVHHAVEACKAATGQRRVIDLFVNKTHIANEVMQAIRESAAELPAPTTGEGA